MKKIYITIICGLFIIGLNTASAICSSCSSAGTSRIHTGCTSKSYQYYDADYHKKYCCCGEYLATSGFSTGLASHSYSYSTSKHQQVCSGCQRNL